MPSARERSPLLGFSSCMPPGNRTSRVAVAVGAGFAETGIVRIDPCKRDPQTPRELESSRRVSSVSRLPMISMPTSGALLQQLAPLDERAEQEIRQRRVLEEELDAAPRGRRRCSASATVTSASQEHRLPRRAG